MAKISKSAAPTRCPPKPPRASGNPIEGRYSSGGKYVGFYRKHGQRLVRESDGLILQLLTRPVQRQTPAKSDTYLVDKSVAGGKYVSSLWDREFEYGRIRYRMEDREGGTVHIHPVERSNRPGPAAGGLSRVSNTVKDVLKFDTKGGGNGET